jgi:CDP-4-dehydro-6-deoxyglucose reductase
MAQRLNLARAAQLVGVPRSVLQKMIRHGTLASFDGMVEVDDLRRAFPDAALENGGASEKVARIRAEAFGRRLRERLLPSQEALAQRLYAQSQELADVRRYLQAYHALVVETQAQLRAFAHERGDAQAAALAAELEAGLKRVLATEPAQPIDAMANMLDVISAQVTVRPSGHQFVVEGNESILQAGLRAGLRLAYGCGTGTCGLCKARIVSGETRPVMASDYRLTEQEKTLGYKLLCAHTPVTDVVIETLEARGPADVPEQQLEAKVRALAPLGADTLLLHLQTRRSSRLRFLAGQAVTLGAATAAGDVQSTLPLASCPCDERNLHFHVARDADDEFAQRLFAGDIAVNASINVRGPSGEFVLAAESPRPLLMVACDTGFAPVKSLIEAALAAEEAESITLHWLATRADGHYLANQCRAWAEALDHFRYRLHTAAQPEAGAHALAEQVLAEQAWRECDVYVAGPAPFVDAVGDELTLAGAARDRLHFLSL